MTQHLPPSGTVLSADHQHCRFCLSWCHAAQTGIITNQAHLRQYFMVKIMCASPWRLLSRSVRSCFICSWAHCSTYVRAASTTTAGSAALEIFNAFVNGSKQASDTCSAMTHRRHCQQQQKVCKGAMSGPDGCKHTHEVQHTTALTQSLGSPAIPRQNTAGQNTATIKQRF